MTTGFGVGLYSPRVAARVARIRYQNFQAWAKANLLVGYRFEIGRYSETTYTYKDLLLLRLITRLREQGIKPKAIRVALETIVMMAEGDKDAWMRSIMYVTDGMIAAILPAKPDWNPIAPSKGPQKVAAVFFPKLIQDLKTELVPVRFTRVEIDPEVLGGAPVVKGTRITTRAIGSIVDAGDDPKEAYPQLDDEEVRNAVDYEAFLTVG